MKNFSNSYKKFILGLDEINKAANCHPLELIKDIEQSYKQDIAKTAEYILNMKSKRKIVMISGPSASGKTTTTRILKSHIENLGFKSTFISLDNFYKGREEVPIVKNGVIDFESPEALNINEFKKCMFKLLKAGKCSIPKFDFITKTSEPNKIPIELNENDVAIIEGIHGLNPVFTSDLPEESTARIYISVKHGINDYNGQVISNRNIRLIRRLVRDYEQRKSDPEMTLSMWNNVCKGQSMFIYPFKRTSDLTINSLHLYELGVMKKIAIPLLEKIKEDSPVFKKSLMLISALERFTSISEDLVPTNSLIREFIGGGVY